MGVEEECGEEAGVLELGLSVWRDSGNCGKGLWSRLRQNDKELQQHLLGKDLHLSGREVGL